MFMIDVGPTASLDGVASALITFGFESKHQLTCTFHGGATAYLEWSQYESSPVRRGLLECDGARRVEVYGGGYCGGTWFEHARLFLSHMPPPLPPFPPGEAPLPPPPWAPPPPPQLCLRVTRDDPSTFLGLAITATTLALFCLVPLFSERRQPRAARQRCHPSERNSLILATLGLAFGSTLTALTTHCLHTSEPGSLLLGLTLVGINVAIIVLAALVWTLRRRRRVLHAPDRREPQPARAASEQGGGASAVVEGVPLAVEGVPLAVPSAPPGVELGLVHGVIVPGSGSRYPPLQHIVGELRRELGLPQGLSVSAVVERSCAHLGVDLGVDGLLEKAHRCWDALYPPART